MNDLNSINSIKTSFLGGEPTYENHMYHPHRPDGLDRNLRKLNKADWEYSIRCTCKACCASYESSRKHRAKYSS